MNVNFQSRGDSSGTQCSSSYTIEESSSFSNLRSDYNRPSLGQDWRLWTARRPPFGRSITWILTSHQVDTDGAPVVSVSTLLVGLSIEGLVYRQQYTVVMRDSQPSSTYQAVSLPRQVFVVLLSMEAKKLPHTNGFYLAVCNYGYVSNWQYETWQSVVVLTEFEFLNSSTTSTLAVRNTNFDLPWTGYRWRTCCLSFDTIGGSIHLRICLQTTIYHRGGRFSSLFDEPSRFTASAGIGSPTLPGARNFPIPLDSTLQYVSTGM